MIVIDKSGFIQTNNMAMPPDPVYVLKEIVSVNSVVFLNSSVRENILLAGTEDGKISEWNIKTYRKENSVLNAGTSVCLSLKVHDNKLLTQEKKGVVNIWTGNESGWSGSKFVHLDYYGFCNIDVGDDLGGIVVCPNRNATVEIYSLKDNNKIGLFKKNENDAARLGEIMALKIIHINQEPFLLSAYENGSLYLWDFKTQHVASSLKTEDGLTALDFSDTTMKGMCGSVSDNLLSFNIEKCNQLISTRTLKITNPGVGSIKIRPDNKIVVVGCWDGYLRIYSWKSLRPLAVLTEHSLEINDMCFSTSALDSNSTILAAASRDKRISLWDIYNNTTK